MVLVGSSFKMNSFYKFTSHLNQCFPVQMKTAKNKKMYSHTTFFLIIMQPAMQASSKKSYLGCHAVFWASLTTWYQWYW